MCSAGANIYSSVSDIASGIWTDRSNSSQRCLRIQTNVHEFQKVVGDICLQDLEHNIYIPISPIPKQLNPEDLRDNPHHMLDKDRSLLSKNVTLGGCDEPESPENVYPYKHLSSRGYSSAPELHSGAFSDRKSKIYGRLKRPLSLNFKKRLGLKINENNAVVRAFRKCRSTSSLNKSGDSSDKISSTGAFFSVRDFSFKKNEEGGSRIGSKLFTSLQRLASSSKVFAERIPESSKLILVNDGEQCKKSDESYTCEKAIESCSSMLEGKTLSSSEDGDVKPNNDLGLVEPPETAEEERRDGPHQVSYRNCDLSVFQTIISREAARSAGKDQPNNKVSIPRNNIRAWEELAANIRGAIMNPTNTKTSSTYQISPLGAEGAVCRINTSPGTIGVAEFADDAKRAHMRMSVIRELIKTEKDYIRDLEIIIYKFLAPIHSSGLISKEDENKLFSNIEGIYQVNSTFLTKLLEREKETTGLAEMADILVEVIRDLYIYADYCSNYPTAIRTSKKLFEENKELKALVNNILKDPEIRGLSFGSFLIKPVQRICKYPLLIKDLDKYTSKISKETIHIKLSLKKLDEVMRLINNSTQILDEEALYANIMSRVDPPLPISLEGKRLIREGYLGLYTGFRVRRRYCVLLDNVFIVFRYMRNVTLKWARIINFDHMTTVDISMETLRTTLGVSKEAFKISVPDQLFESTFIANSEIEKVKWIESFDYTIKRCRRVYDEGKFVYSRRSVCHTPVMSPGRNQCDAYGAEYDKTNTLKRHSTTRRFSMGKGIYNCIPVIGARSKSAVNVIPITTSDKQTPSDALKNCSYVSICNTPSQCSQNPWREALSAIGVKYYYNVYTKESSWIIPPSSPSSPKDNDTVNKGDYNTPSSNRTISVNSSCSKSSSSILTKTLTSSAFAGQIRHVKGYPNWYYFHSSETPYYFNIVTRESRWDLPQCNTDI